MFYPCHEGWILKGHAESLQVGLAGPVRKDEVMGSALTLGPLQPLRSPLTGTCLMTGLALRLT